MTIPLSQESIGANLRTKLIGHKTVVYRQTTSTNDIAWRHASDKADDGLAVFAESQAAGRGRAGSTWVGGDSMSVLCSVLLLDTNVSSDMLTLASGVAVAETVGKCGRYHARIKWPNDVILGRRKVAGILIESRVIRRKTAYVIGIGINCSQSQADFPPDIADIATSIDIETGGSCNRNAIAKRLLVALDEWIAVALAQPQEVTDAWLELCSQLHQRVALKHNNRAYSGNCLGVDPQKGLIVQLDHGGIRMFDAAHTYNIRPT